MTLLGNKYEPTPRQDFVQALADHHPSDAHDDRAILVLRTPR
ncbi:hypothetical protein [Streptomyces sp. NPDC087437]